MPNTILAQQGPPPRFDSPLLEAIKHIKSERKTAFSRVVSRVEQGKIGVIDHANLYMR